MKSIETICSHRIEFYYDSKSKYAIPNDSEFDHVKEMLIDNYREGELCMMRTINNKEREFRGWWKILPNP